MACISGQSVYHDTTVTNQTGMKRPPREHRKSFAHAQAALQRDALIDAVAAFQAPVCSADILVAQPTLARRPADLSRLAKRVVGLGPDARGRRLVPAGMTSNGSELWNVLLPAPAAACLRLEPALALLALVARPGESCVQAADRLLAGALAGALEELRPKAPPPAPEPEPELAGHDEIVTEIGLD